MSELFYSLPTWDLHNIGSLFNIDTCGNIDESPENIFRSPEIDFDGDVSTGYLEDALIEYSERIKRRRLSFNVDDNSINNDSDNYQNNWGLSENYSCTSSQFADESPNSSINISSNKTILIHPKRNYEPSSSSENNEYEKKKKKKIMVYPFGVVKPGGRTEDITLNDINRKILTPPARPVRHPVGVFACRPCVSAHGPGLSGKSVVALTKIQTLGKGTITIIRTKG